MQEIVVIVKERQEVRFFSRGDLHPAEHQQPVSRARLLDGQNVFRRVMVAHADQLEALLECRVHDFTGRHIEAGAG